MEDPMTNTTVTAESQMPYRTRLCAEVPSVEELLQRRRRRVGESLSIELWPSITKFLSPRHRLILYAASKCIRDDAVPDDAPAEDHLLKDALRNLSVLMNADRHTWRCAINRELDGYKQAARIAAVAAMDPAKPQMRASAQVQEVYP